MRWKKLLPGLLGLGLALWLGGCRVGAPAQDAPETSLPPAVATVQIAAPQDAAALEPTATTPAQPVPLKVFCAGSLILPFEDLERAFEAAYPAIDVQNECHGSIQVIRHVTELHELIDVVATADHALIPMLMYANTDPETGAPYADWYIHFAGNSLALAYTPQSRYAQEVNTENWPEIIFRPGVRLGLADPRFDPAGYRALMAVKLAEDVYEHPTLFASLVTGRFLMPIAPVFADGRTTILVPEIVQTRGDSGLVIRGASIQLIALLQTGDLDYAFEYLSVIRQHGLEWIDLPPEINLGAPEQAENYARVGVKIDFQRFASVQPEFQGEVIGYGITIPSNAPHPQEAAQFIAFLLGPEGRQIMAENFQPLFDPARADGFENMPAALQTLTVPSGP